MTVQLESLRWTDQRSIAEIVDSAIGRGVDYLAISAGPEGVPAEIIHQAVLRNPSVTILAFVDRNHPARDLRLTSLLPPLISFIAARPEQDLAVAISVQTLPSPALASDRSQSLCEFVVRMSKAGAVSFVEVASGSSSGYAVPRLAAPSSRPQAGWLRELIERIQVLDAKAVTLTALRAGLFLLNDLFDESHACSQSIEGEGQYHTGDYWHAILHRREPDYGNSKYWFRRVGKHPIFADLARGVEHRLRRSAIPHPLADGNWDPFAFVDLCAGAESNPVLEEWCEQVQYLEMLLLLEHSYREAAGLVST
jgi:Fe-S-cluster formation regulator IscX/YfhJ